MTVASSSGLEGVVAADTAISDVDGERGRLIIAGKDVEVLAQHATFEEATARVLAAGSGQTLIDRSTSVTAASDGAGRSPGEPEDSANRPPVGSSGATGGSTFDAAALGRARQEAWEILPRLGDALDAPDGMDALRAALGHIRTTGNDMADALAVIGAAPVFVAAWSRKRSASMPCRVRLHPRPRFARWTRTSSP
jgi:citrate synthase